MVGLETAEVVSMGKELGFTPQSDQELKLMAKASGEFAKKQLAPNREENDKYPFGPFFSDIVEKAFELDFFHMLLPEEMNGMNQGIGALGVIMENICREDSSLAGIIFTTTAAQELMWQAGAVRELKTICVHETLNDFLIAFPVFNNPSEVKQLVAANETDGRYSLSGTLDYLVLGDMAKQALIPVNRPDSDGMTYFLVDLHDKGIRKSEPVLSLGLHGCPAVDVEFNQVNGILIGEQGQGEIYFEKMADRMHAVAAAMSLGIMKGSFQEALSYAKKREQGGQAIINWSEVKMMLAEIALHITNAEMILAQACRAVDAQSSKWETRCRAAALHIQQAACNVTTDGIQVMGGVGYMKDFGQEKRFRDAKQIQALLGIAPAKKIAFIDAMM